MTPSFKLKQRVISLRKEVQIPQESSDTKSMKGFGLRVLYWVLGWTVLLGTSQSTHAQLAGKVSIADSAITLSRSLKVLPKQRDAILREMIKQLKKQGIPIPEQPTPEQAEALLNLVLYGFYSLTESEKATLRAIPQLETSLLTSVAQQVRGEFWGGYPSQNALSSWDPSSESGAAGTALKTNATKTFPTDSAKFSPSNDGKAAANVDSGNAPTDNSVIYAGSTPQNEGESPNPQSGPVNNNIAYKGDMNSQGAPSNGSAGRNSGRGNPRALAGQNGNPTDGTGGGGEGTAPQGSTGAGGSPQRGDIHSTPADSNAPRGLIGPTKASKPAASQQSTKPTPAAMSKLNPMEQDSMRDRYRMYSGLLNTLSPNNPHRAEIQARKNRLESEYGLSPADTCVDCEKENKKFKSASAEEKEKFMIQMLKISTEFQEYIGSPDILKDANAACFQIAPRSINSSTAGNRFFPKSIIGPGHLPLSPFNGKECSQNLLKCYQKNCNQSSNDKSERAMICGNVAMNCFFNAVEKSSGCISNKKPFATFLCKNKAAHLKNLVYGKNGDGLIQLLHSKLCNLPTGGNAGSHYSKYSSIPELNQSILFEDSDAAFSRALRQSKLDRSDAKALETGSSNNKLFLKVKKAFYPDHSPYGGNTELCDKLKVALERFLIPVTMDRAYINTSGSEEKQESHQHGSH